MRADATPPLTLHGHWRSSCSQRVQIGLRLKNLPFRYVPVDLAVREQEGEVFRSLHPGSQVPVLVAGETVLTQSLAILEWLEESFPDRGTPLLPDDPGARSRAREIAQFVATGLQPFQLPGAARRRLIATLQLPEDGEALCATFSQRHLEAQLPELQRLLNREAGPFCLGQSPGLADCCVIPQLEAAARLGVDVNRWPRLSRLAELAQQLPAFRESEPLRQSDAPAPSRAAAASAPAGSVVLRALAAKEPPERLATYLLEAANEPIPELTWVRQETARLFPALLTKVSGMEVCLLLRWLTRLVKPRLVLEVGVFTGSSSLAIASALPPGGRLIGFDVATATTAVARQAWRQAGLAERVELHLEDAGTGLPRLLEQGLAGQVDLAYVDGDNEQYGRNLEALLGLLRPGGVLVFDNTLWKGQVADPASEDRQARHLRDLNRRLKEHPDLISCVLSLGDGVSLAIRREVD